MPYSDLIGKKVNLTAWQIKQIDKGVHHLIGVMVQGDDHLINDIYDSDTEENLPIVLSFSEKEFSAEIDKSNPIITENHSISDGSTEQIEMIESEEDSVTLDQLADSLLRVGKVSEG